MNLFTTIDVVYTRMKRDTRIEIPVYKLIHVRKYTCLKPYVLQIIRVWNHTRYKSYALQTIRVWNHTRYKLYAYEIIRVINHTRMKSYALQIIRVWNGGISLDDQRQTPVLLSPRNARRNVLRHDGLCATSQSCSRDATTVTPYPRVQTIKCINLHYR